MKHNRSIAPGCSPGAFILCDQVDAWRCEKKKKCQRTPSDLRAKRKLASCWSETSEQLAGQIHPDDNEREEEEEDADETCAPLALHERHAARSWTEEQESWEVAKPQPGVVLRFTAIYNTTKRLTLSTADETTYTELLFLLPLEIQERADKGITKGCCTVVKVTN